MLNSVFDSTTIPLLQKLAVFGEHRQVVLAGNIANIDTPDYKMRDLPVAEFRQALKQAIENRQPSATQSPYTLAASPRTASVEDYFPDELFAARTAEPENITFQDANNRSIEHANMEMMKNAMLQNFAVELMHAQFNMLQAAISERA